VAVLRAGLDVQGALTSLQIASAGDAITPRWIERGMPALAGPRFLPEMPDKTASEGLFDLPYGVPNQRIAHVATRSGVPVGFWRSVGHSHHAFFSESFIDELAVDAAQDPVTFRLALLKDMPHHAAVLRLVAEKSGWPGFGASRALPTGQARGVALHESFGSIVAQVVELSLVAGQPKVHRVVCAADVGVVVNPAIVAQQMEGGIVFGLTAALYGRIDIDASVVRQRNFPDYRLLPLAQLPRIETHLIASTRSPGGVGEPGTPPLAPALGNALFALTGQRQRSLPFRF
jgi:isoquinoline 1-oxidoreductase subunit beta